MKRRWKQAALVIAAFLVVAGGSAGLPKAAPGAWRLALPGYRYRFPRDHAAHPGFQTEWWYYTGHVRAPEGAVYGFELTFFRVGIRPPSPPVSGGRGGESRSAWALHDVYFAHFALTDPARGRFRATDVISRGALDMAGARTDRYHVWIDDWLARLDGQTHELRADHPEWALDLRLRAAKPPVIHGFGGVSQKAAGRGRASHYYSLTRMQGSGRLRVGEKWLPVEALAWMDHEWGSNQLAPDQVGWDWFSIQLDDGRELMLYRMRRRDGSADPVSSGTLIEASGRARPLRLAEFRLAATEEWRSRRTGGRYPSGWQIQVPGAKLDLTLTPTLREQELVTRGSSGVAYWEGAVRVSGSANGVGYVELTGYAPGSSPGL
jgi:predicted secreted hydrolase